MSNYFSQLPDFEYVSRLPDANISDYIPVKNLFKKGALREDIFQNLSTFTKYIVSGDKRPDNVAFEFYGDSSLDWLVLASNNIVNVKTEWPMQQLEYNQYLLDKYGSYEKINEVHHYETVEIRNGDNVIMVQKGLKVASDYSITYFDSRDGGLVTKYPVKTVTNYEYEEQLQDERRNIFLLKPQYLSIALDDLELIMTYKKGSSQYKTESMKTADNIRLFE